MSAVVIKIQKYKCRLVKDGKFQVDCDKVNNILLATVIFQKLFKDLPHEELHVIYLNNRSDILGTQCLAMGGLSGCAILTRDIFRGAIAINAGSIILGHNHPSGDPTPSEEDIKLTEKIDVAGKLLGIALLDHIIIAKDISYSFYEHGLVK